MSDRDNQENGREARPASLLIPASPGLGPGVSSDVSRGRNHIGIDMPSPAQSTKALLVQRASAGTSLAQSIEAALVTWSALDAALSPIIGPRGFVALYKRSLQFTKVHFPWLASAQEGASQLPDFSALGATLAQQSDSAAAAASAALLKTFYDLLTNLIGPSLTDRLLRSVCETPSSGPAAQDTSP